MTLLDDSIINVKGNSWDFPIMAKYRFGRVIRPYVAGGAVLRYIGPVRERGVETVGSVVTGTVPRRRAAGRARRLHTRFLALFWCAAGGSNE